MDGKVWTREGRGESWLMIRLAIMAALVAGTTVVGSFSSVSAISGAELRAWVSHAGGAGPPLFVVAFLALNTAGVPFPVLGAAAGVAFDPVLGATTLLIAMTTAACAQFLLARHVTGEQVRRRLGHGLARVNRLIERRGILAVALARIVPGPFSELNMLAGLTSVHLRDFTIGTVIGCAPKALAWSGLGSLLF